MSEKQCKNCKWFKGKCVLVECDKDGELYSDNGVHGQCPKCGANLYIENWLNKGRVTCKCGFDSGEEIIETEKEEQPSLF